MKSEHDQQSGNSRTTVEDSESERFEALRQLEEWLELPVIILGFVWLVLLVVELIWGLNPFLNMVVYLIWGVFVLDFLLRLILAPHKWDYLKQNWLTALSLGIPALRIARIARIARLLRAARAARGLRLVSLVSSLNRGMRALRNTLSRRGFGYVAALTLVVTFVGAAGMYAFENAPGNGQPGLGTYGEALWWTAMMMTTLGSDFWPLSPEGRMLSLLLALYAFAVFGYVTATLASFFIGREANATARAGLAGKGVSAIEPSPSTMALEPTDDEDGLPSASSIRALRNDVAGLRQELHALRQELRKRDDRQG